MTGPVMPPRPRFPAYDTSTHRRARPWNRRAPAERGRVRRRRHVGEKDILVLRIELHPAGLVESVEGQLLLF